MRSWSGKTESDLSGQTLALDFTDQSADVVPVLLLSTATATKDALAFEFKSAVSVIGITNPVLPKATTADKLVRFTVSGHKLVSSGVVSVSEDGLIFTGNALFAAYHYLIIMAARLLNKN